MDVLEFTYSDLSFNKFSQGETPDCGEILFCIKRRGSCFTTRKRQQGMGWRKSREVSSASTCKNPGSAPIGRASDL